jgi:hypothetical protein
MGLTPQEINAIAVRDLSGLDLAKSTAGMLMQQAFAQQQLTSQERRAAAGIESREKIARETREAREAELTSAREERQQRNKELDAFKERQIKVSESNTERLNDMAVLQKKMIQSNKKLVDQQTAAAESKLKNMIPLTVGGEQIKVSASDYVKFFTAQAGAKTAEGKRIKQDFDLAKSQISTQLGLTADGAEGILGALISGDTSALMGERGGKYSKLVEAAQRDDQVGAQARESLKSVNRALYTIRYPDKIVPPTDLPTALPSKDAQGNDVMIPLDQLPPGHTFEMADENGVSVIFTKQKDGSIKITGVQ